MRALILLILASTLAACGDPSVITANGWAALQIGMSSSEARDALGSELMRDNNVSPSDECTYMHASNAPGLRFMFEGDRFVRVETNDPRYSTPSGIHVGDSEAAARKAYEGQAHIEPHKYSPKGFYLIIPTADGKRAVVIETYEGKVMQLRGGSRPAVEYVEGCS